MRARDPVETNRKQANDERNLKKHAPYGQECTVMNASIVKLKRITDRL